VALTNLGSGSRAVDVDDTSVGSLGTDPLHGVGEVLGEESRGKSLGNAVVELDGLLEGLESRDVEDCR